MASDDIGHFLFRHSLFGRIFTILDHFEPFWILFSDYVSGFFFVFLWIFFFWFFFFRISFFGFFFWIFFFEFFFSSDFVRFFLLDFFLIYFRILFSRIFFRSFWHQRINDTTLGSRDRGGGYPTRDREGGGGGGGEEEGLVLEYSRSWMWTQIWPQMKSAAFCSDTVFFGNMIDGLRWQRRATLYLYLNKK